MDIDGLHQTEGDPGPEQEHVVAEDHDANEEASPEDDRLSGVSVFCLHAKRSLRQRRDMLTVRTHSFFLVFFYCKQLLKHA